MRPERLARAALAVCLLSGIPALLVFQAVDATQSAGRRVGFVPDTGSRGVLVTQVFPGQPAERAGLAVGDQIVQVEAVRVGVLNHYERAARGFRRGEPVTFRVARGDELLDLRMVPGVPARWAPVALNALGALAFLGVALLALSQRAGDLRARLLFGFCAAVSLEYALPLQTIGRPWVMEVTWAAYYLLTAFQIGLELHLASLIPSRPPWLARRPWMVPVYYGFGLALGLAPFAAYVTEGLTGRQALPWSLGQAERVFDLGLPVWALTVAALLAFQTLRASDATGRHQAGLVLAATLPWLLFLVATTVADPLGAPLPFWVGPLESLLLLGYPIAFFAAIYRYHLFDLELAARRGLLYTTLTGALVLAFYAAVGAGGALFSHLVEGDGRESVWVVSAATLMLGLLFSPLRRWVQRVIDRRFFPERHALRKRLIALAGELPALGHLPAMGQHLVSRLSAIFRARSAALLIADPEARLLGLLATATPAAEPGGGPSSDLLLEMDDPAIDLLREVERPVPWRQLADRSPELAHRAAGIDRAGLAVPLVHQERLVGLLFVGRKEGGQPYPAEELDLLNLLAHHVATVLENARLFESATYEGLTGLLRREAILDHLSRELERALRYGRPLTVAMADLDHFKQVNDRHGHLAGDALLRRIAQVVAGGLRSTDSIGRYGGEEFLLVLPETELEGAGRVAEKVRSLVQASIVPLENGGAARVTISIGLATLAHPGPEERSPTLRDLLEQADRSLYQAKNEGRNRVYPRVA